VKFHGRRGVLLRRREITRRAIPCSSNYWITAGGPAEHREGAERFEIRKGDILLVRTGWRKTWDEPDASGVSMRRTRSGSTTTRIGPDSLKFFNDNGHRGGRLGTTRRWSGIPARPKYQRKAFGISRCRSHDFLWNRGAYIMEILNLDELAKDQRTSSSSPRSIAAARGIGVPINRSPSDNIVPAVVMRSVKKSFPLGVGGRRSRSSDIEA